MAEKVPHLCFASFVVSAILWCPGGGILVILNTNRTQTFNPDAFTNMGCDFASQRILIVKSTNHFYPAFAKIASEVLYVDTGLTMGSPYPSDPSKTPFTKITRAIWCEGPSASFDLLSSLSIDLDLPEHE